MPNISSLMQNGNQYTLKGGGGSRMVVKLMYNGQEYLFKEPVKYLDFMIVA